MTSIEARHTIRSTTFAIPVVVAILSWAYLLAGAGTGMNLLAMTTPVLLPPMNLPRASSNWTFSHAVVMVGMWWTMMLAMMMPGAIVQSSLHRRSAATRVIYFYAGYSLAWLAFSLAAATLQMFFERHGWLHPMKMWSLSPEFSASLLVAAALYQFLPVKQAALSRCSVVAHKSLSLVQGLSYGGHCLTASGPMMLLLYVGGVMNLYWIIGLSAAATVEKTVKRPKFLSWAFGCLWLMLALHI